MHSILDSLHIVLVRPKYPENVGSAARACVNMGCPHLVVVSPARWDETKAMALATPKGAEVLKQLTVHDDLTSALAGFTAVFATTARTGGWRKGVMTVKTAAKEIMAAVAEDAESGEPGGVAVVFGPEDTGLTNEEIEICGRLLTIPTADEATSLNLAQAVLLVLYECFALAPDRPPNRGTPLDSRLTTHQERQVLYDRLEETLTAIDFLKQDNPEYWMMAVRRFLDRVRLRRNEFNLVLGVLRQVRWISGRRDELEKELGTGAQPRRKPRSSKPPGGEDQ